jgi:hypothetical protein
MAAQALATLSRKSAHRVVVDATHESLLWSQQMPLLPLKLFMRSHVVPLRMLICQVQGILMERDSIDAQQTFSSLGGSLNG